MKNTHQICQRCVMDTTDPEIVFDENGVCNHCHEFDRVTSKQWHPDAWKPATRTIFRSHQKRRQGQ